MSKYLEPIFSLMALTSEEYPLTIKQIGDRLSARGLKPDRTTILRVLRNPMFDRIDEIPTKYFIGRAVRNKVSISFTPEEIQALALILKSQQESSTTYISGAASDILSKILKTFTHENENLLKNSLDQFHFTSGIEGYPKSPDNEIFKNIMKALKQRNAFECSYHSPYKKSRKKRHFLPLRMIYVSKAPYIFCKDLDDDMYKTLKIIRISDFNVITNKKTVEVDDKEIDQFIKTGFGAFIGDQGEARIIIDLKKGSNFETYLMENMIHKSQKITSAKSSLRLELFCPASGELERLLNGFRDDIVGMTGLSL